MKIYDLINADYTYKWDVIETIPEFAILKSCEQSPKWHAEGNAYVHTQKVCEDAINVAKEKCLIADDYKVFLAAALFHDIGKGVTTHIGRDGNYHSYNHEIEGEKITRWLLWDEEVHLRERVCALVRWHMEPLYILKSRERLERINYLFHILDWELLIMLKMCDVRGSMRGDGGNNDNDIFCLEELKSITTNWFRVPLKGKTKWEMKLKEKNPSIYVTVLIGLSGAGKSTFANLYSSKYVIISRDFIRAELGFCKEGDKVVLSTEQEKKVSDVFNLKLLQAAREGKDIMIDNLNLKKKYRDAYKNLLKDFNIIWNYVYVYTTDISTNLERRNGVISKEILKNMIMNFDWPTPDEYDVLNYFHDGYFVLS